MFYIWFSLFRLCLFEVDLAYRFNSCMVLNFDWRNLNCNCWFLVFELFCFGTGCFWFCSSLFESVMLLVLSFLRLFRSDCVFIMISLKTGFPDGESVCLGFSLACLDCLSRRRKSDSYLWAFLIDMHFDIRRLFCLWVFSAVYISVSMSFSNFLIGEWESSC